MPFEVRRRWIGIAVTLLVLSACGLGAAPVLSKVVVDQLQTDLVFGATQPSPPAAPAPPAPLGLGLSQPQLNLFPEFGTFGLPTVACPKAPSTSFPAQEASSDVTVMPTAGAYSWVGSGTYNYSPIPTITVKIPIAPMFTEYLRHVRSLPPSLVPAIPGASPSLNFTYESTVPQLGSLKGGFYDLFWQVKSNASAGDPEGGLVLKRIDTLDSKGNDTGKVFDSGSGPGLLVLPLPAAPGPVGIQTPDGNLSQSISVDTSGNGNNLEFSGTVGPRERVDACGTWLQAWPVDGTLTNGAGSAKIHLDVATQFGAVPLALNFVGDGQTFLGSTLNNVSLHTGQSTPGALPKEWQ